MHSLGMKINLPTVPHSHRAFIDEEFYVNLFKNVFEAAANSLSQCYQSHLLQMSNFVLPSGRSSYVM